MVEYKIAIRKSVFKENKFLNKEFYRNNEQVEPCVYAIQSRKINFLSEKQFGVHRWKGITNFIGKIIFWSLGCSKTAKNEGSRIVSTTTGLSENNMPSSGIPLWMEDESTSTNPEGLHRFLSSVFNMHSSINYNY